MGLDVCIIATEQFFRTVDGGLFGDIRETSAAMKSRAGISFESLIGDFMAQGIEYRPADDILRRDKLNLGLLPVFFITEGLGDQRVTFRKRRIEMFGQFHVSCCLITGRGAAVRPRDYLSIPGTGGKPYPPSLQSIPSGR